MSCGEEGLPARSRFCLRCGAAVDAGGAATYTPQHLQRDVLVFRDTEAGERKEVTVLIADVAGSLAMAEALDPEDIHALMDGFFALALEAIHAERGTVNQFRGDGFMALFGAPRARGDDVARALRAALAVRSLAREYAESVRARYGLPFAVRMGLSTGLVWVGTIGNALRRDYTAEGPTVGLAARLEELAAPGEVLVSEETARRADGFELRDLGARSVRGLGEPVRVFGLVGERAAGAPGGAALSPFVGRAPERARLARVLARETGLACVEVVGEAGIGKSRLVAEALAALPADGRAAMLVCRETSARRAYAPWLDWLRTLRADRAAELARALEGRGAAPLEPPEVARTLRAFLAELLAAGPVAIVLDDAHWLDPSSRQLVHELTGNAPQGALTFLATLRDEQAGDWGACGRVERVTLGGLSGEEALRLAELAATGLEPELAELAHLRGGGNPLFVEEVARALRDGSPDLRSAARLEVSLARARERVPDTLRGVVAARIDALPESAKRILELAAVVGERFDLELVRDVASEVAEEPADQLDLLVARGLLHALPEGEYDFRHGVVRAGTEAQLVRERLASLHRRIADALAKRPLAETAAGASRIGSHFDRAGDALAAVPHLHRAGQAYVALRAFIEAVAHLRRAYELLRGLAAPPPELDCAVGLALASALGALDRGGEAAAVLESLDLERASSEDRLRLATVHVQAGWLRFSNDNDVTRGRALVERGLRALEGFPAAADARLMAWSFATRMDLLDGRLDGALAAARRVAELATARGDAASLAAARYNECAIHCETGRLADARTAAQDAADLVALARNDWVGAAAETALARVKLAEGDAESALVAAARADELARRCGQVGLRYLALVVRGYAELQRGDAHAAHTAFEALVPLGAQWPSTRLHRARGALETGDLAAAAELAERALDAPRAIRARSLAVLGLARGLAGGQADEAEHLLAEAMDLCDALGLWPSLAEAGGFQAELCARRGDRARAAHYAARAADGYARCGMHAHAAPLRALCTAPEEARRT